MLIIVIAKDSRKLYLSRRRPPFEMNSQNITLNQSNRSGGLWPAILLITFIAIVTYGPLMSHLDFYRDDWYQIWAGNTLGASSLITLKIAR